jgi:hypothetical protein
MKRAAVVFLAGCLIAPALGIESRGNMLIFTDEDMAACIAGGGCVISTRQALSEAIEATMKQAKLECINRI